MDNTKKHNTLKEKIMEDLQKFYLGRLEIHSRSAGNAYFKRGNKYYGPYQIGQTGASDLYGSLSVELIKMEWFAFSFAIEVKTGKGVLSAIQKKRLDHAKHRGIKTFVARDLHDLLREFIKWGDSLEFLKQ